MKSKKILLSILVSIASGVLIGILFAPKKGSKTRRIILQKGEEFSDSIKNKLNDISEAIAENYDMTLTEAKTLVKKGKTKYEEGIEDLKKITA